MCILEGVRCKILWSHVHVIQNLTIDQYMKDEKGGKKEKNEFFEITFYARFGCAEHFFY